MDYDGLYRSAEHGSVDEATIVAMADVIREALLPFFLSEPDDPRQMMGYAITAAQMYSGQQFGILLFLGSVTQQDTARAAKAAARNFREGIKVGLGQSTRLAAKINYGGAVQ